MLVTGAKFHEKFINQVSYLVRAGIWPVDFIDDDDRHKIHFQGFAQNKAGLGHGSIVGIHQQKYSVHHFEYALYFPAKIRVTRGVHNVDAGILIADSCIFGHDRDPTLTFDIIRIHQLRADFLILTKNAALF